MNDNDFWDDYEFNFFMDLEDEDKLLYIYDLMIGDFTSEYFGEADFEFELEEDSDTSSSIRTDVVAVFDENGYLTISGPSEDVLDKVASDMMMNGMILSERKFVNNGYDDLSVLTYKVVGSSNPISLN